MADRPLAEEVLRVDGLVKDYGKKRALDGVSFSIRSGDLFGFLGPNGAGKTTTIRIVLGLIRADAGQVSLFGEPRRGSALSSMARIGALVEEPRFYSHLSGRKNLTIAATLAGIRDPKRIDRALEDVRLSEPADDPVKTFSQGMRQRLGIAQALLADPELVLLDEPTNGLDPHGVREMRSLILRLNQERGLTILVSSHQLAEVEQLCDRVAVLRRGRLLVEGRIDDLLHSDPSQRISYRIGVTDPAAALRVTAGRFELERIGNGTLRARLGRDEVPALIEHLVAARLRVTEVVPERPTLLHYFLELTEGETVDLGI